MRRTGLLISGWAVATVLALMLGLLGVRAVSDSVTTRRTQILSPASVRAALSSSSSSEASESAQDDQSDSTGSESAQSGSSSSSPRSSASDSGAASNDASDIGDAEQQQQSTSAFSAPSAPESSFSSDGGGSDDNQSSSTQTTTVDRTYTLVGGSVGVHFENGAAHFVWAVPNEGFSKVIDKTSPTVEVRFTSATHESRLKAYWDNGPQAEIDENDHDDG